MESYKTISELELKQEKIIDNMELSSSQMDFLNELLIITGELVKESIREEAKKKKTEIVIVEDFGENNEWRWWDIYKDTTREEALKEYWQSVLGEDGNPTIKEEEGYLYIVGEDVRATTHTI